MEKLFDDDSGAMYRPRGTIECTACDHSADAKRSTGRFSYLGSVGSSEVESFRVREATKWCHSCSCLVPAEDFSDRATLQEDVEGLEGKIDSIEQNRGGLTKLFIGLGLKTPTDTRGTERALKRKRQRIRFFLNRESPPRCLVCGSKKTERVKSGVKRERGNRKILHAKHPGCGGNLVQEWERKPRPSGIRITPAAFTYSLEGLESSRDAIESQNGNTLSPVMRAPKTKQTRPAKGGQASQGGKPKQNADAIERTVVTACSVTHIQLELAGIKEGNHADALLSNPFCLGYFYGFCDGLIQATKMQSEEGFEAVTTITLAFIHMFGEERGPAAFRRCTDELESGPKTVLFNGTMEGGQDALTFLKEKAPPSGLASALLDR